MRVTQDYRNLMLEQEFENDPDPTNHKGIVKKYIKQLNSFTEEAHLAFKNLERFLYSHYIDMQSYHSEAYQIQPGDLEFRIFTDDPIKADAYVIAKNPISKYPEKKAQVVRIVEKLRKIYRLQVRIIDDLADRSCAVNLNPVKGWFTIGHE